jgi:peptidoglycan/xylan/chitin deacetylase (PgdA/CDA1 family)
MMYHYIGPAHKILLESLNSLEFERQIKYLVNTFHIIHLDELVNAFLNDRKLPQPVAVITFDDGYQDLFQHAYPVLRKYKVPATIFLATGAINANTPFWWDKLEYSILNTCTEQLTLPRISQPVLKEISLRSYEDRINAILELNRYLKTCPESEKKGVFQQLDEQTKIDNSNFLQTPALTWDQIRAMSKHNIKFGAHTVSHCILTRVPLTQAENEIRESQRDIERHLEQPVTTFAYPNGLAEDFNTDIKTILQDCGFLCAVTAIPGMVSRNTDRFAQTRLGPGWNYDSFRFLISGLNDLFR